MNDESYETQLQETPDFRSVMDDLKLEVVGEGEDGRIELLSKSSRKKTTIRNTDQLKMERLVQICGPVALKVVEKVDLQGVRAAIAEAAYHAQRFSADSERRQGIWETADGSIGVVAAGCFCKWDGRTLHQAESPIEGNDFYDTTSARWTVDFPQLKQDLEQFDREKCRDIFRRFCGYLSHWIWMPGNPEQNAKVAELVAGLSVATFVQSVWRWRPQVSISGVSHSGKTTAFELFRGIFGDLAVGIEKSTTAGMCQALQSSASACFVDEFEHDKHRTQMLDIIKTSGSGAAISRGTADLKGTLFRLQHIFWVAAIEDGIHRVADLNRFIRLELHKPTEGTARLKLPSKAEYAEFQRHLLAASIYYAAAVKELVEKLVDNVQINVDARIVENYAVPVAMASLILGDEANAEARLREALALIPVEREFSSDHDDLLAAILESHLSVPEEGTVFVRQAIRLVLAAGRNESAKHSALTIRGIRIVVKEQERFVLFSPRLIERFLLKGTSWKGKNIRTILRRIPGAVVKQQRFNEARDWAIVVPAAELDTVPEADAISELLGAEN